MVVVISIKQPFNLHRSQRLLIVVYHTSTTIGTHLFLPVAADTIQGFPLAPSCIDPVTRSAGFAFGMGQNLVSHSSLPSFVIGLNIGSMGCELDFTIDTLGRVVLRRRVVVLDDTLEERRRLKVEDGIPMGSLYLDQV